MCDHEQDHEVRPDQQSELLTDKFLVAVIHAGIMSINQIVLNNDTVLYKTQHCTQLGPSLQLTPLTTLQTQFTRIDPSRKLISFHVAI